MSIEFEINIAGLKRLVFFPFLRVFSFVVLTLFSFSTVAESLSPKVASAIVSGKLKQALKSIEAGEPAPRILRKDIEELLGINKVVAEKYRRNIGGEVDFYARKHKKRGTLLKVEKGKIFVRITTGKASAKWTVKIASLPIAFRMRMADTSSSARMLYLGIKSLKTGSFSIAKALFEKLDGAADELLAAADEKYGKIYSLMKSAFSGDGDTLKKLLSEKVDPNRKIVVVIRGRRTKKVEKRASTLLIETIKRNQSATANLLLDNGADPNAPDSKGITPLMYAVAYFPKDLSVVGKLLEMSAVVSAVDKDGNTAFSGTIAMGRLPAFKLLLENGIDINKPAGRGLTPLMMAVGSNNFDMFKILMDKGADPTIRHPRGWTVLDMNRNRMHPGIKAALDELAPRRRRTSTRAGVSLPGVNVVPRR